MTHKFQIIVRVDKDVQTISLTCKWCEACKRAEQEAQFAKLDSADWSVTLRFIGVM